MQYLALYPLPTPDHGRPQAYALLNQIHGYADTAHRYYIGNNQSFGCYIALPSSAIPNFLLGFDSLYLYAHAHETKIKPQAPNVFFHRSGGTMRHTMEHYSISTGGLNPLNQILLCFDRVPATDTLTFHIETKTDTSSILDTLLLRAPNRTVNIVTEEDPRAGLPRRLVSLGFSYQGSQTNKNHIQTLLSTSLSTIIQSGSVSIGTRRQWISAFLDQLIPLVHLPQGLTLPNMTVIGYKKPPAPLSLTNQGGIIGYTDDKKPSRPFGLSQEDKCRHLYIVGKTGVGKSTLLSNLILNDIADGAGLCVLDPHGELVENILPKIPSHRVHDVIWYDVGDTAHPIPFSLFSHQTQEQKILVASGILTTFAKLFSNSRGPRLEYILRNVLLSVIEYPHATMLSVQKILTDKTFRTMIVSEYVHDEVLRDFWINEFGKWSEKQIQESIGPITNKIGQCLSSPIVRAILGSEQGNFVMADAMNSGKIVLINLSKGKIGEDNANLLGSLMTTKIQIDAMARATIHPSQRKFFALYIDEFQNFVNDSFVTILSEARKYKLALIMAHQYTSQLPDEIKQAIFGNIGSMISFTIGVDDARILADQFGHGLVADDFLSLPKFRAYAKLTIQGNPLAPFVMQTALVSQPDNEEIKQTIIMQTRKHYATPRLGNDDKTQPMSQIPTNITQKKGEMCDKKPHIQPTTPSSQSKQRVIKPTKNTSLPIQSQTIPTHTHATQLQSNQPINIRLSKKFDHKPGSSPKPNQNTNTKPLSSSTQATKKQKHEQSIQSRTTHDTGPVDFGLAGTPNLIPQPIPMSGPGRIPLAFKQAYVGTIVHTKNYGCMIQVEDSVGLLHKSEIIEHFPKDERKKIFVPGKTLKVYVKRRSDSEIERTVYNNKSGT